MTFHSISWGNLGKRSNPDHILKRCIIQSLKETEKERLSSIAIPAISCGVLGGVPSTCVTLIVEAVVEYFSGVASSYISQVWNFESISLLCFCSLSWHYPWSLFILPRFLHSLLIYFFSTEFSQQMSFSTCSFIWHRIFCFVHCCLLV